MKSLSRPGKVSIVIPTFNGEEYLKEVLDAVFSQRTDFDYDVLIIDSGSSDTTLEIVRRFERDEYNLRLIQIKAQDFNHGETRNQGVRETKGEFVVFLTQDATPVSNRWLQNLRDCFDRDPKIVAVFGKHIARPDCNPITKRDIAGVFLNISPSDEVVVQELNDPLERERLENNEGPLGFYSDVNSCLRRTYWEDHPYPKIDYAEDQFFGKTVLLSGYKKAYCPEAAVYHSHNFKPGEFLLRYFDEYRGLNLSIGYRDKVSLWTLIPEAVRGTIRDIQMTSNSEEYGRRKALSWSYYAWRMNFSRRLGAYLGARHNRLPAFVLKRLSLESRWKGAK